MEYDILAHIKKQSSQPSPSNCNPHNCWRLLVSLIIGYFFPPLCRSSLNVHSLQHHKPPPITYPSISIVLLHKLAIVVVVECWVALHPFLLAKLVVLSFSAVHSCVHDLKQAIAHSLSVRIIKHALNSQDFKGAWHPAVFRWGAWDCALIRWVCK